MSARRANRGPSNRGGPGPRKTAALAVVPDPLEREMAMRNSVGLDGRPEQPGSRCVRTFLRRIGSRTDPAEQFPSAITARLQNEIEAAKAGAGFTVVRRFPARDAGLTRIDQNHSVDPSIQLMLPADPARARASRYGWIRVGRRSGARARRIGELRRRFPARATRTGDGAGPDAGCQPWSGEAQLSLPARFLLRVRWPAVVTDRPGFIDAVRCGPVVCAMVFDAPESARILQVCLMDRKLAGRAWTPCQSNLSRPPTSSTSDPRLAFQADDEGL